MSVRSGGRSRLQGETGGRGYLVPVLASAQQPRQHAHAVFWYNLHIVLVHEERWREIWSQTDTKGETTIYP